MPISEEARIKKNLAKLKPLSVEKLKQLQDIELKAIARFSGQLDELESALGFLRMGFQFGWKPMAIIHSKKTFRKYEQILDINARVIFPEDTPTSERSIGYALAVKLSKFWKVVSGEEPIENKRTLSP
jgi:hypothetical protein